jgi:hypothetical protein
MSVVPFGTFVLERQLARDFTPTPTPTPLGAPAPSLTETHEQHTDRDATCGPAPPST